MEDRSVIGESNEDRTQIDYHVNRPEVIQAFIEGTGISIYRSTAVHDELMNSNVREIDKDTGLRYVRVAVPTMNSATGIIFSISSATIIGKTIAEVVCHHQLVEIWQRCKDKQEDQVSTLDDRFKNQVERLHLQAKNSGLSISVHVDPDLTPVLANPSRIEQVVVNLLLNAIKFTPPGGSVELCASLDPSGSHVVFSVKDTDTGIIDEDRSRISERFYKVYRAGSGGDTGLGLSISRPLVDAYDGSIWVESKIGVGSTFYSNYQSFNSGTN